MGEAYPGRRWIGCAEQHRRDTAERVRCSSLLHNGNGACSRFREGAFPRTLESQSEEMTKQRTFRSSLAAALIVLVWSPVVSAQSPPVLPSTSLSARFTGLRSDEIRPTTTTFPGDTGIWYIPTAEILRRPAALPEQVIGRIAPQIEQPQTLTFEDVYFDLDGYTLRPEATAVLDDSVKVLLRNATLNINIEGHTCDLGSAEYNIALGDRRAEAVKDYFVRGGVSTSRLHTASYGEENPEHANVREEARRLNRRVTLVVRLQP
jgi:outer membrane protein OmpA-like peptidoglycan-associated protein